MVFVFGECTLDVDRRELRRAGVVRALQPKAFTVLVHLLTQRHRAVSKDELLATCWPGEFVTPAALTRCLKVIRQAVGDDGVRQHVIKTLRDHGYRFVAPVETQLTPPPPASLSDPAAAMAGVHSVARLTVPTPGLPCPQCQTLNRATRQFCAACGHALQGPCPHCGFGNDSTERFCGGCGRELGAPVPTSSGARMGPPQAYTPPHLAQRMLATPLPPPGERKQVTVLVGEVEGLRTLRQAATAEAVDDVLNHGFALLAAEVHRVEGFISQVAGHGFTVLFGAPLACEDHVLRALHAALGIQRVFTGYAAELQQTLGVSLTLRLGVHTGSLVVSAISTDLRVAYSTPEATLEIATGLQQCAAAGMIAVSVAVHEAAAGFFRFTVLGQYLLPESPAPMHVYTCDGVGPVTSRLAGALARGQTTFQGRTRELAFLENCWTQVCRGAGQVVCLIGEAGIGKSRLAYECQQMLAEARWLTLQALPYGQAMPYHAFLPLLRTVLGVQEHADSIQQQKALQTHLATCAPSLAAEVPFLAHLLGLSGTPGGHPLLAPEVQRRRVQQACLQVLVQQADEAPLGVLVEDGHWLDPSSQELLDLLVAALARRRIFVLCTARPGFRHPWADYTYFHQMAITPLAATETEALLQDLLQPYGAASALQAWLYARTGGNPFFVEELVRALRAHELLTVQAGVYAMAARPVTLPASIQGIVQTRLDRLPTDEKHLLQMAAVIGLEVPLPLLQVCMGDAEAALHRGLTHLQALEFLYETRQVPVRTYTFKHTLVQEAAYQSLLKRTQQQYHAQIAQLLATQFPDIAEIQPELLAQHYTAAGLGIQALPYWQRAGGSGLSSVRPTWRPSSTSIRD
jgi:DNA-binding winged helix-turn-helix (wHTH) protein/class 3 adenylate cyclase/ABC-type cobalamin transport system ATPase subunit